MNFSADIDRIAGNFYTTYCAAVGGLAFNGDPLPSWDDFSADSGKVKQVEGWRAVARKATTMSAGRLFIPHHAPPAIGRWQDPMPLPSPSPNAPPVAGT